MRKLILFLPLCLLASCVSSPKFYSEQSLASMAQAQFSEMKQNIPISNDTAMNEQVQRVGERVAAVVNNQLPNAQWEFVVFADEAPNAFAMPGGKIGVYTGLLNLIETDDELAAVMGHEVAHVLLEHSNERMSAEVIRGAVGVGAAIGTRNMDEGNRNMILAAYGIGSQIGIMLPYSRSHETEADRDGLFLSARAGYDPRAAISFWQKMSQAGGAKPPEFLSTHPSHGTRISNLNEWMPEALRIYQQFKTNQ